jgi:hypothetical protein
MRILRHVLIVLLALPATALAQGGRPEIIIDTHHDVSPPLREMPPGPRHFGVLEAEPVRHIPSARVPPFGPDAVLQAPPKAGQAAVAAPATVANFDGVGQGFTGPAGTFFVNSAPPDTNGAVGPNHFVEIVNTDFAVFTKSGAPIFGPVPIDTVWSGFAGNCAIENDGDPIVTYDRIGDRWIISQFQVTSTPFQQCVAVSTTPDPTGSYARYAFNYPDGFPDYPKMGVWPDAYYVTYNVFNNAGTAFLYAKTCALDRAHMLTGAAATQVCFNTTNFGGLLPADFDGRTLPAAGAPNPIVALGATSTTLALWRFHTDFTTPANSTFTGPTTLTVPAYAEACAPSGTCVPQSGGGSLDSLSDRLMYRAAYRNFGDHESIVVNHSVTAGSSVGLRWYELRGVTTSPSVFQSGTFAPDANFRWMGSAAMDQSGNVAIGYSVSSASITPQIRVTGRLAGDPAGTLTQGETTVIAGAGAQGRTLTRWGDYSSMSVDPVDDCTFYYSNEYIPANGTFNWRTRVASFRLSPCGGADFSLSASPSSVSAAQGGSGTSTITVTPTGGFTGAVALSISGLPAGATASFSPASTTSTSVLTLGAGTAAAGSYPLTVTGTSGSLTHTTTVTLTITGAPDFSLSASPSSVSAGQGGSGTTTITVTPQNGFNGSVTLTVTGLPPGASGSFNPVTTASTSVLTLTSGTAAAGTYPLTVTGTSGGLTHTTSVTLTITGAADFSLSASPSSVSAAQGGSGTTTITVTPQNGFNGSVSLSVTGLPQGASGSFNPVTTASTSVLTLNAGTAALGTYTLTVTGTSAALTHTATVTFVVTSPGSFSLSATPASLTVQHGKNGAYTITITRAAGFSGAVTLAVSGLPSGVTGTFNPSTVTGTSSTLAINAIGNAQRRTVTLTITGTSAGAPTTTTTASLTIR